MFNYDPLTLVGIGDVLVIGGTDGALEPIHGSFGPWIVEDIDDAKGKLLANGASVVQDIKDISNGRMMYMKHADGTVVEYVQWTPELIERHIFAPLRAGTPASQI
jgi:phosphatidate phosphatase PAH1